MSSKRGETTSLIRTIARRLGGEAVERLEMFVGFLSGNDPVELLRRLKLLIRHRDAHDQLRHALTYDRYMMTLMLARRTGLLKALQAGPLTADETADACGIQPRAAELLLRILESMSIVERDRAGYAITEFAREFVLPGGALTYSPLVDLLYNYSITLDAIVEGMENGEVPKAFDIFDDDRHVDATIAAVNGYLEHAARELLTKIDLPHLQHFIVGSMGVSFSALVLDRFEDARVTYGCLDHLVERIPRLREQFGVDPESVTGTHSHGGEPSEDRWGREEFDLVFLTKKMILEPENHIGEKFARKAYDVLTPGGVAIFWEVVFDEDRPTDMIRALESILDLGVTPGGALLTDDSFRTLLRDIGYDDVEFVTCLAGETGFVVARK